MASLEDYNLEQILHAINSYCISISDKEKLRNNRILHPLLVYITSRMCEINELFKELFTTEASIFYGGSYYDNLKVGSPDEYDIDLLMNFPKDVDVSTSNISGYVFVDVKENWLFFEDHKMDKFCEITRSHKYLNTSKVLSWVQGLIQKALNTLPYNPDRGYNLSPLLQQDVHIHRISTSGPAFTLHIKGNFDGENICISVDLVPCFAFRNKTLPQEGFKSNRSEMDTAGFFIVPKNPKNSDNIASRYWRLSLQEQERKILHNKGKAKPSLRLLKKMRLKLNHCIDSYYLKTMLLWEIKEKADNYWFVNSLSLVFVEFLKTYKKYIENGNVPYYWNKHFNLIEHVNSNTLYNISKQMEYIIRDIEANKHTNPSVIIKYILTNTEQSTFLEMLRKNELKTEDSWKCTIL